MGLMINGCMDWWGGFKTGGEDLKLGCQMFFKPQVVNVHLHDHSFKNMQKHNISFSNFSKILYKQCNIKTRNMQFEFISKM